MSSEDLEAAKADVEKAIKAYYKIVDSDSYVGDWVVICSRQTTEMVREHKSLTCLIAPYEQDYHRTTGLIAEEWRKR